LREEFGDSQEGARLERLLADLELVNELRLQGFRGPGFDELARALAEYGYQVLGAWIRSGVVFGKLREKKIGHYLARFDKRVPPPAAAKEMTNDVVAEGIIGFRDEVLRPGKWHHERGASLATYFIGQCLHRFPKIYIRWLRETTRASLSTPFHLAAEGQLPRRTAQDPEGVALIRDRLETGLNRIPPMTTAIILLVEEGFSHAEISHSLGISVGSIESRLHRHRKNTDQRRRVLDDSA